MISVLDELTLTEYQFYKIYFELQNVRVQSKLTNQEIDLMALICCKPTSWILDSQKSKNRRSKKYELAQELGVKNTAIYALLLSIQSKKYLIKKDDDFLYLPKPINNFRIVVKDSIANNKPLTIDYIFRFKIEKNAE